MFPLNSVVLFKQYCGKLTSCRKYEQSDRYICYPDIPLLETFLFSSRVKSSEDNWWIFRLVESILTDKLPFHPSQLTTRTSYRVHMWAHHCMSACKLCQNAPESMDVAEMIQWHWLKTAAAAVMPLCTAGTDKVFVSAGRRVHWEGWGMVYTHVKERAESQPVWTLWSGIGTVGLNPVYPHQCYNTLHPDLYSVCDSRLILFGDFTNDITKGTNILIFQLTTEC